MQYVILPLPTSPTTHTFPPKDFCMRNIVNVRSYREWEGGRETVISSLAYAHADRHPKRLSTLQGPYLKPPCIHEYNTHNYSIKDDYLKELTVNVSHI